MACLLTLSSYKCSSDSNGKNTRDSIPFIFFFGTHREGCIPGIIRLTFDIRFCFGIRQIFTKIWLNFDFFVRVSWNFLVFVFFWFYWKFSKCFRFDKIMTQSGWVFYETFSHILEKIFFILCHIYVLYFVFKLSRFNKRLKKIFHTFFIKICLFSNVRVF